jgi:hypothetical protein
MTNSFAPTARSRAGSRGLPLLFEALPRADAPVRARERLIWRPASSWGLADWDWELDKDLEEEEEEEEQDGGAQRRHGGAHGSAGTGPMPRAKRAPYFLPPYNRIVAGSDGLRLGAQSHSLMRARAGVESARQLEHLTIVIAVFLICSLLIVARAGMRIVRHARASSLAGGGDRNGGLESTQPLERGLGRAGWQLGGLERVSAVVGIPHARSAYAPVSSLDIDDDRSRMTQS